MMENHSGVEIELTSKIGEKLAGVSRVKPIDEWRHRTCDGENLWQLSAGNIVLSASARRSSESVPTPRQTRSTSRLSRHASTTRQSKTRKSTACSPTSR